MGWFFAFLPLIANVACTIHVVKTGRPLYWIFLIWVLHGVGAAVYFFVEILPDLQGHRGVTQLGSGLVTAIDPGRRVRKLEEELEISDTVKNRQVLAKAYVEARRFEQAIAMFDSCLKGIYRDDPPVLLAMAEAQFLNHAPGDALGTLTRLSAVDGNFRPMERRLLLAQVFEALGRSQDALSEYESLANQYPGEEARCRYGLLLLQVGQADKAQEVFQRILLSARRSPRYYRKAQRKWIQKARQHAAK
ncbi:MAG: tetratricopeptide repeat protein [Thermoguttaceae bacterium]